MVALLNFLNLVSSGEFFPTKVCVEKSDIAEVENRWGQSPGYWAASLSSSIV
jgi:hypothetical protein